MKNRFQHGLSIIVFIVFLFLAFGSTEDDSSKESSAELATKQAIDLSLYYRAPQQQRDFTKALYDIKKEYEIGSKQAVNDIQKKELRASLVKKRKQMLRVALGEKKTVTDWVGRVKTIYSDELLHKGKVQLSVTLPAVGNLNTKLVLQLYLRSSPTLPMIRWKRSMRSGDTYGIHI